jgi:hypothetical protein
LVEQGSSPIVKLIGDNRSITDNNVIDISRENSIRIGSGKNGGMGGNGSENGTSHPRKAKGF